MGGWSYCVYVVGMVWQGPAIEPVRRTGKAEPSGNPPPSQTLCQPPSDGLAIEGSVL